MHGNIVNTHRTAYVCSNVLISGSVKWSVDCLLSRTPFDRERKVVSSVQSRPDRGSISSLVTACWHTGCSTSSMISRPHISPPLDVLAQLQPPPLTKSGNYVVRVA